MKENQDQLNREITLKLKSVGLQDQKELSKEIDLQESNECFYKYQEFYPQNVKININSTQLNDNLKDNELRIPIFDGNEGSSQIQYCLNPFFYTSLEGIAIFNSQQKLIFENQQLQIIQNLFDKKETSSETILSIKINKDSLSNQDLSNQKQDDGSNQDAYDIHTNVKCQGNENFSQIPNSLTTKQTSQLYFKQQVEQSNHHTQMDILINKAKPSENVNKVVENNGQISQQKRDKNFDFCNQSSNYPAGGQGVAAFGSTNDKPNELNDYQNTNLLSPQAKGGQFSLLNQKKGQQKINYQQQSSDVQIDFSNFIQESQNNLNGSYYGNKLTEIKKSQGLINQPTDSQSQGQFMYSNRQYDEIQKRNSLSIQENDQKDFFFKKREDLKSNLKLQDLLKNQSQFCMIKDILSLLLDPVNYYQPKKEFHLSTDQRIVEKSESHDKGNIIGYSIQDSYDSYTPINSKLIQQQNQKLMFSLNNKAFKNIFEILVDDSSILIQKILQPSNIIVTIKIIVLQQFSFSKQNNLPKNENLFALIEFNTSNQGVNLNNKQDKKKKIDHFTQSISWLEKKITAILEPCFIRVNLFKQYCNKPSQNLSAEEQKTLFITPLYNSFYLINNVIENAKNFTMIKEDKFILNIQQFNIITLISECLDIFRQQAIFQNIQLELKIQKNVKQVLLNDKLRLQQMIVNFLASSIKYTLVGKVQIQIDYIPLQQMYKIIISDTGVGIDQQICSKIAQIMNLTPHNISEYDNIFSNDFSLVSANKIILNENQSPTKTEDKFSFSNISQAQSKQQLQQYIQNKEDSFLKYIKFQILNFIAKKLGASNSIQFSSKKGFGSQFIFYVQDQSQNASQNHQNTQPNEIQRMQSIQSEIESQNAFIQQKKCSLESKDKSKNQQEKLTRNSSSKSTSQQKIIHQQNKEMYESSYQQTHTDKKVEENKSDFYINSMKMFSDKEKQSSKDQQSTSHKNNKFRKKNLNYNDSENTGYEESCNIQSEVNSRLSQNYSQKAPKCQQFVVTHKIKDESFLDDSQEQSPLERKQYQCSIKLRKCKTQAGFEDQFKNQLNLEHSGEEYHIFQYGILIENDQGINKRQNDNSYDFCNISQPHNCNHNPLFNQKYPTSFYKCENPMQGTSSEQNESFNDFSSQLQNYFAPSKSQNQILFNNQAHKPSPITKNNQDFPKNFDGLIKQKSTFKKAYSMRHVSSEFSLSEQKSHYQKNTEFQNQPDKDDIQRYLVQDSPLFIQSQKAIRGLNEDIFSQNVIKKVQTEFTQRNSTVFQQGSSPSIKSKKTERKNKLNFKQKECNCNQILVVEQTENNMKEIKESLYNLHQEADYSLFGKQLLLNVKNKYINSVCCPQYKLIFVDTEFSFQQGVEVVQNISKIYSLSYNQQKPLFCSYSLSQKQPNQIQQNQEDNNKNDYYNIFDFSLHKNISSNQFDDIVELALA